MLQWHVGAVSEISGSSRQIMVLRHQGQSLYLALSSVARLENAGRAVGPKGLVGSRQLVSGARGAGHLLGSAGLAAPMAVGAVSAISGSSRQIIWKASGPVSDLSACVIQFNSANYTAPQARRGHEHPKPLLHQRTHRLPDGEGQGVGGGNFTKLSCLF